MSEKSDILDCSHAFPCLLDTPLHGERAAQLAARLAFAFTAAKEKSEKWAVTAQILDFRTGNDAEAAPRVFSAIPKRTKLNENEMTY